MPVAPAPEAGDAPARVTSDEEAAELLQALASPVRLRILSALVRPMLVTELRIAGERGSSSALAARQTLQAHLDRLEEVGLVGVVDVERNGRSYRGYVASTERIRDAKAALREIVDQLDHRGRAAADGTFLLDRAELRAGPHLTLLSGTRREVHVPLGTAPGIPRRWSIGRSPSADVVVRDDPYVSGINAFIEWIDDALVVRDAPGSANGTIHNGVRLASGARMPLRNGDVITIGRSSILYTE